MKSTHLLFIVFSGMILASTLPQNSYACSCVSDEPIEDRVDETDIIFSGKLIERIEDIQKKTFIFEIDKLWKNNSDKIFLEQKNFTIFTAIDEGVCGTDFTVGLDYLVYADMREKFAYTSLCSGNDLLFLKNIDLEFLSTYNEESEELQSEKDHDIDFRDASGEIICKGYTSSGGFFEYPECGPIDKFVIHVLIIVLPVAGIIIGFIIWRKRK